MRALFGPHLTRRSAWVRPPLPLLVSVLLLVHLGRAAAQQGNGPFIRLRYATFDPLRNTPQVPTELRMPPAGIRDVGLYLLQFVGPVRPEWVAAVKAKGVVLEGYVPDYAFIARMTLGQAATLPQVLPFVRWTGAYHPAYKIAPEAMTASRPVTLLATTGDDTTAEALTARLEKYGAGVIETAGDIVAVAGSPQMATQLARAPEVLHVDVFYPQVPLNDVAARIVGVAASTFSGAQGVRTRGLFGSGQIVGVADTGLDTGNLSTLNADFAGRVIQATCWGRSNDWSDPDSHGTHVAGSVLGSGVNSGSKPSQRNYDSSFAGMAPEARLVMQSLLTTGGGLVVPADLGLLLGEAYNLGARVHNNSYGAAVPADNYTAQSVSVDRFLFDHPDMVVVFGAGNSGQDANGDGVIDLRSLAGPYQVAKNVITVGASENLRPNSASYPANDPRNLTWRNFLFNTPPFATDYISNNMNGMAAFSSRGPTADGRIKPDVVAPGTNIVSVWSLPAAQAGNSGYGPWAGPYSSNPITRYVFMGGTSMASPIATGACALVREFYETGGYQGRRFTPSAALVKATLINGAADMNPGQYGTGATREMTARPNFVEGWGRVDLANTLYPASPRSLVVSDNTTGVNTGVTHRLRYAVTSSATPLRVTLVWTDPPGTPGAARALVNNLDLVVVDPNGQTLYGNGVQGGDVLNNVEGVDVNAPPMGSYEIRVVGTNVPMGPQAYALVVSGPGYALGGKFVDMVPPTIRIVEPARASSATPTPVTGLVRIVVDATDDRPNGIDKVTLTLDGKVHLGTRYAPPYVFYWSTPGWKGVHKIKAECWDFGKNYASDEIDVTVVPSRLPR